MALPEGFTKELLDHLNDGVYFVDRERKITFWNRGAQSITGWAPRDVIGRSCPEAVLRHVDANGNELCRTGCPLSAAIAEGKPQRADVFLHHRAGHRVPVRVEVVPFRDAAGAVVGAVEVFTDQTERMEAIRRVEELTEIVFLDPLTGIGNRRYAEVVLEEKMAELTRYGFRFGVLFVDVDRFKEVNDTHGHDVGDAVLKTIATTLARSARSLDFVGRWGGEEFIVLLSNVTDFNLSLVADRTRRLVEHSELPMAAGPLRVTVSIGATLVRKGEAVADILKRADGLMYEAKSAGRNRVVVRL
ncbi:MAG: GGDEF domain-containing protein [Holophagales bacterium]|nr:GGDEF domain-containing protein [Holophagales bacterium]MBK9969131.1 GGDEF domain-containing protein [Holophagales bacterium]